MKKQCRLVYVVLGLCMFAIAFFTSCSQTQRVSLAADGSGTAEITLEMHQVLIDYLQDFSEGLGYGTFQDDIFDPLTLAAALQERGIILTQYSHPEELLWHMAVRFDALQLEPLLTITEEAGLHTLRFQYNYEIFQAIRENFGPEIAEFFDLLGPGADYVSQEEYIEFLLFAFEAYIDNPTAFRLLLEQQNLRVTIALEGEFVAVQGGQLMPSGEVEFVIPMLDFASGNLAMDYFLQWKDVELPEG